MHFHLPKPIHGWREFLGEVGIIVVGVLIALGAEQVVEAAHWQERVERARGSLAGELGDHYAKAVEWRTVEPCVNGQLERLQQRLLASGARLDPAPMFDEGGRKFALRAPSRPFAEAVWQGIVAEGVSSHLADEERLKLSSYYRQLRDLDELDKGITEHSATLRSLTQPIPLDAMSRLFLLQSIEQTSDANRWMGIIAAQLIGDIDDLRMVPDATLVRAYVAKSGTATFCRAQNLPLRTFADAATGQH